MSHPDRCHSAAPNWNRGSQHPSHHCCCTNGTGGIWLSPHSEQSARSGPVLTSLPGASALLADLSVFFPTVMILCLSSQDTVTWF